MSQAPEITTRRLRLRAFRPEDAQDVFEYARDPEVLRYTTGRTPRVPPDIQPFMDDVTNKPDGAYAWAVRLRDNPRVIGAIEFGSDGAVGTIHGALAKEYWGKGLMTEAARAVLGWAFATLGLERVTTEALAHNKASIRVMQKCGMTLERLCQDKWDKFDAPVDLGVYTITRQDWLALRRDALP